MADYNALFQVPNAGAAFQQAFQQGQKQRKDDQSNRAMTALAVDPTNQQALNSLAVVNPEAAISFREKQQAHHLQELSGHRDAIKFGAQVLKSINPHDEATYQQALQMYAQGGGDLTHVPQHWDATAQEYVKNVVALDAQLNPDHDQTSATIREFQQAQTLGLIPQGTSYQAFLQMKNPGMSSPVTLPYGATVQGGGSMTATDAHGNKVQYNPQSGQWEPMGGAGGNASSNFHTGPQ